MTKHPESILQKQCVAWFKYQYPAMSKLIIHIPNGLKLGGTPVQRAIQMNRAKLEGLQPGTPDLFIAAPSVAYCGLWIEMKSKKGKLSEKQNEMMKLLTEQGYHCCVCNSFEAFQKIIKTYFK